MGTDEMRPEDDEEVDEERATVLIVEDDEALAAAMSAALENAGYQVTTIATAEEWRGDGDEDEGDDDEDEEESFLVEIVDADMEGLGGVAGVISARDGRRCERMIALVGEDETSSLDDVAGLELVAKPLDLDDLLEVVAAAAAGV